MSNTGVTVDSHSTLEDSPQSIPLWLGAEELIISPKHIAGFKDKNHQRLKQVFP